jgi:hypothetical protein
LVACGIKQQRCRANCGIGSAVIQRKRSTTKSGVKATVSIGRERPPSKRRISLAGRVANERTITLKRTEVGAATVYTLSLRF